MIVAVLDTNVLVSAYCLAQSVPGQVVDLWFGQRFEAVLSRQIVEEFEAVMARPKISRRFAVGRDEVLRALQDLRSNARIFDVTMESGAVLDDPKDAHVLNCAVGGRFEFIVSGDRHLLKVESHRGVTVLPPALFLTLLKTGEV